ncbi:hypothetical protein NKG94_51540 [Micromonospora sp. M12]
MAQRHGLTLNPVGTSHVADIVRDDDLVIAVCDNAHEELTGPVRPRLHWSVPDPSASTPTTRSRRRSPTSPPASTGSPRHQPAMSSGEHRD